MKRPFQTSTRSVKSWAFNGAAAVSAAFCIVALTVMIQCYGDRNNMLFLASWGGPGPRLPLRVLSVSVTNRRVVFTCRRVERTTPFVLSILEEDSPPGLHVRSIDLAPLRSTGVGFTEEGKPIGTIHNRNRGPGNAAELDSYWLPTWVLALLTALAPALWTYRFVRRRRRQSGHLCTACGYDLRATPGRCPECGAVPAEAGANERSEPRLRL